MMIMLLVCLNLTFILYISYSMTLHDDLNICLYNGPWIQCGCAYIHSEHPLVLGCDWLLFYSIAEDVLFIITWLISDM